MHPIEQFQIKTIIPIEIAGYDVSFTNAAAWMVISVLAAFLLLHGGMRGRALVPSRIQAMSEMVYEFVANMVRSNAGQDARPYFPAIFTLFMFILMANMLGLVPAGKAAFTPTSHIVVTGALAILAFIGVNIVAFARHGLAFFKFFFPPGAPVYMAPLIVPIEVLSYLARPVSLAIRLFANMMAGHTMLKVFAGFSVLMGVVAGVLPLVVNVALVGFEILVAVLQAYVFAILTCLYLHDALEMH